MHRAYARYCDQLNESLAELGFSRERFMKSHTYQNAAAMYILQLGELTKQLSSDFLRQFPQIPWSEMAKTRDSYAHHYGRIDFEMVWDTAVHDIPTIRAFCKQYLA